MRRVQRPSMTPKKLSARDFGAFKVPTPSIAASPACTRDGPQKGVVSQDVEPAVKAVAKARTAPRSPPPWKRPGPPPTGVTLRRRLRGQAACESTALGALVSLRQLEEELRTLAFALRDRNPATLRPANTWRKKPRRAIAGTSEARALLDRFRESKPQPAATSALRLLLEDCGARCMGCPHPKWAVWTLVADKNAPGKPARRVLVKLTGRAALDNHAYAQSRTWGPGPTPALPRNEDRTPARAAHLLKLRVLAYARKSPDPNTLLLVKRILQVIDTRRRIVDVLSQLGRLSRAQRI